MGDSTADHRCSGSIAQPESLGDSGYGFSTIHTFALTWVLNVARCRPSGDGIPQSSVLAGWVHNTCDLPLSSMWSKRAPAACMSPLKKLFPSADQSSVS